MIGRGYVDLDCFEGKYVSILSDYGLSKKQVQGYCWGSVYDDVGDGYGSIVYSTEFNLCMSSEKYITKIMVLSKSGEPEKERANKLRAEIEILENSKDLHGSFDLKVGRLISSLKTAEELLRNNVSKEQIAQDISDSVAAYINTLLDHIADVLRILNLSYGGKLFAEGLAGRWRYLYYTIIKEDGYYKERIPYCLTPRIAIEELEKLHGRFDLRFDWLISRLETAGELLPDYASEDQIVKAVAECVKTYINILLDPVADILRILDALSNDQFDKGLFINGLADRWPSLYEKTFGKEDKAVHLLEKVKSEAVQNHVHSLRSAIEWLKSEKGNSSFRDLGLDRLISRLETAEELLPDNASENMIRRAMLQGVADYLGQDYISDITKLNIFTEEIAPVLFGSFGVTPLLSAIERLENIKDEPRFCGLRLDCLISRLESAEELLPDNASEDQIEQTMIQCLIDFIDYFSLDRLSDMTKLNILTEEIVPVLFGSSEEKYKPKKPVCLAEEDDDDFVNEEIFYSVDQRHGGRQRIHNQIRYKKKLNQRKEKKKKTNPLHGAIEEKDKPEKPVYLIVNGDDDSVNEEIFYFDDNGKAVDKDSATKFVVRRTDKNGNLIGESFGTVLQD